MDSENVFKLIEKLKKLDEENLKLIDIGSQFLLLSQETKEERRQM